MSCARKGAAGRRLLGAALLVPLAAAGCGDAGNHHPVSGRVLIDGRPLAGKAGSVLFKPDTARGTTSPLEPAGKLDAAGNYTLLTRGKNGAPPGRYKVVVVTEPAKVQDRHLGERRGPAARPVVPRRYGTERDTPLTVEVVAAPAPGAYDLQLTSK
jgi:hypothetical protein